MKKEVQNHLIKDGCNYILVKSEQCLSIKKLAEKLDVHVTHAKKHIVALPDFPSPIRYEDKSHPKWLESDVDLWIQTRKQA